MLRRSFISSVVFATLMVGADAPKYDYRLLATSRTSTMEKEMNEAAAAGYVFAGVMGGETAMGGNEVVVVMIKNLSAEAPGGKKYKLLATSKTSTMQKETQQAGDEGFEYRGQTVFESALGGKEVAVIMERDPGTPAVRRAFRLVATSRTSTMQKELREAGEAGFRLLGLTVSKTAFRGSEIVCVLGKEVE
ncbi:MAG: hypothetical protein AAB654_02855 [Acidobacteriota bacterium]